MEALGSALAVRLADACEQIGWSDLERVRYADNCREARIAHRPLQPAYLRWMEIAGKGQFFLAHAPALPLIPDVSGKPLAWVHSSGCSRR
jgi:hypothetical protein